MSHRNKEIREKFLGEVNVGDSVVLWYALPARRRDLIRRTGLDERVRSVAGEIVGIDYYTVRISNQPSDRVVAEQERGVSLGYLRRYEITSKKYGCKQ